MARPIDFWISAVRFNAEHTHNDKIRGYPTIGDKLGTYAEWARKDVVSSIEQGHSFATMYKGSDGNWKMGEDVRIVVVNGIKYLRTDSNSKAADNLGNLPEF